jgi:hypothetical protein
MRYAWHSPPTRPVRSADRMEKRVCGQLSALSFSKSGLRARHQSMSGG